MTVFIHLLAVKYKSPRGRDAALLTYCSSSTKNAA